MLGRLSAQCSSVPVRSAEVTLFSAPNYCGEFDNAGAMMTLDEHLDFTLYCGCIDRPMAHSYQPTLHGA